MPNSVTENAKGRESEKKIGGGDIFYFFRSTVVAGTVTSYMEDIHREGT